MHSTSLLPVVITPHLAATRHFYVEQLGMHETFADAHYLGVRAGGPGAPELGFTVPDGDTPVAFAGRGLVVVLRVADADREHERLRRAGVPIEAPPADMPWGVRTFVLRDPNGVLLHVSHPLPAGVAPSDPAR